MTDGMRIGRRFNGPPGSANGGYACGLFAARAERLLGTPDVAVTLHSPPPLDEELEVRAAGARVQFWHGDTLVAVAAAGRPEGSPAPWLPLAEAAGAEERFLGAERHIFPTCFVCGPDRRAGDGLRLRPGLLPGRAATACTWRAEGMAGADPVALVWALLDCPGGWTVDLNRAPMVLGRMSARVTAPVVAGRRYVVLGALTGRSSHTIGTATTVYDEDGGLAGLASARWSAAAPIQ